MDGRELQNPGLFSTKDLGRIDTGPEERSREYWLTSTEAAQYLRVKNRTLLLWARQGKVKGYPLSGLKRRVWRFRVADLDAKLLTPSVLSGRDQ